MKHYDGPVEGRRRPEGLDVPKYRKVMPKAQGDVMSNIKRVLIVWGALAALVFVVIAGIDFFASFSTPGLPGGFRSQSYKRKVASNKTAYMATGGAAMLLLSAGLVIKVEKVKEE